MATIPLTSALADSIDNQSCVEIQGERYVLADNLRHVLPRLFTTKREKGRQLLKRKQPDGSALLDESDCAYAVKKPKNNAWQLTTATSNTARLLVKLDWVQRQITPPEPARASLRENSDEAPAAMVDDATNPCDAGLVSPTHQQQDNEPPLVPLTLEDHVKFRDAQGNILEVQMCGDRSFEGLHILAADVSVKLLQAEPDYVKKLLLHPTASFSRGFDFRVARITAGGHRQMFLTWLGLIRVLNRSQSPFARQYCTQAAKMLHVAQPRH
ncbi:hypothetical protein HDU88_008383 [Geranomyces variabilis]|nr:hypothetical protein HDU88_008383 [Geranomyces variabilis]